MRFQVPSSEGYELLRQMDDKTPMYVAMQELRRLGTGLKDENGPRQFDFSAAARLDSVLAKFQFRPYCNLVRSNPSDSQRGVGRRRTAPTKGRLILHMVPSGWNPSELTVREALKDVWPTKKVINDAPSEVQEAFLIQKLIGFARSGTIDRIRECLCGDWFLAARTDKRYCSGDCRRKYHTPSEKQRERRRERRRIYQKDYYRKNPSKRSNRKKGGAPKAASQKAGK
jgi:hypothetical protein